jgi:GAG-polyprotein viral zinc-finger
VGCTTDPEHRLEQHKEDPGPWVKRWGPPVEMLVLDTVAREHVMGAEDKAVAVLMWAVGANAVRGGTKVESQEYTKDESARLARFIAGYMNMDNARVFERLKKELPPDAVCRKCSKVTSGGRPLCRVCYVKDSTCLFCYRKGHLSKECLLVQRSEVGGAPGLHHAAEEIAHLLKAMHLDDQAPLPDAHDVPKAEDVLPSGDETPAVSASDHEVPTDTTTMSLSQPTAESLGARTNTCRMCQQTLSAYYYSLCSLCFRATITCYDCGEIGHLRGEAGCVQMTPPKQPPPGALQTLTSGAAVSSEPLQTHSPVPRSAAVEVTPPSRKRYRTSRPRFCHLGPGFCWTCGFHGHGARECDSEKDVNGVRIPPLSDEQVVARCVRRGSTCSVEPSPPSPPEEAFDGDDHEDDDPDPDVVMPDQCLRCGHRGHKKAECVSEKHAQGYPLSPRMPDPFQFDDVERDDMQPEIDEETWSLRLLLVEDDHCFISP